MRILNLPDVTLVTIATVCHELTAMAVHESAKYIKFGDIKVFSDQDVYPGYTINVNFPNLVDMETFVNYGEMFNYIHTSHLLFIQWDGWVIDPGMWNNEFLNYDYIGAPWWYQDDKNVGNSGFCLRSVALMKHVAANRNRYPIQRPEDHWLCRQYQFYLPQFKWAPENLATRFAFERSRPSIESRHFGFHGMFNWPFVLPPDKLSRRMLIARNDPYIQKTGMIKEIDGLLTAHWHKLKAGI